MCGKTKKRKGSDDYHTRALKGMAGEIALHICARALRLRSRILLPSTFAQPVDHRVVIDSSEVRIQSKTQGLKGSTTVYTVANNFRLIVDETDEQADYYSWAVITNDELFGQSDYVTVDLLALAPIDFVKTHARLRKHFGRSVTIADLRNSGVPFSHRDLDQDDLLPQEITIDEQSFAELTSANLDNRLLAALDAIDSPSDASRVLDMLYDEPGLLKAFKAMDRVPRVVQPASGIITVAQRRAPEVA